MWNGTFTSQDPTRYLLSHIDSHTAKAYGGIKVMKKQLLLLGVVFVSSIYLLFHMDLAAHSFLPHPTHTSRYPVRENHTGFLVYTEGCKIQDLDPFDTRIQSSIYREKPPDCANYKYGRRLVKGDTESIYIDWSELQNGTKFSYDQNQELNCQYCEFWRVEFPLNENGSVSRQVDTTSSFSDECKTLEDKAIIKDEEFVQVECSIENESVFTDYFSFPKIPPKEGRLRTEDEVSVLLLGVDALSRLNFHRQMPKTVEFLKSRLQAIEMLGYNKIGDNTFPNLIAVLSGLTVDELTQLCWEKTEDVFDYCPFLWKKYKEAGFQTAFAEDSTDIGLFNYLKSGFRKQPTDYYGQIFNLVAEAKIGHDKRLNTKLCIGNRMTLEVLLETAKNYVIRLKNFKTWAMFWSTSLSHDMLNLPKFGDETYVKFLEDLLSEDVFNTTVVLFLSDHGIRWGPIRETYQGYIEERLPVLFIAFPQWFEGSYPLAVRNLRTNRKRLTTPFDLHQTLLDLIEYRRTVENEEIKKRAERLKDLPQREGISLFLPVPESRTCKDARITDNWCTCHTSQPLSTNDTTVQHLGEVLVQHLNQLLRGYAQCSKLQLNRIISARMEQVALDVTSEKEASQDRMKDYFLVVETSPGGGRFEATLRYRGRPNGQIASVIDPVSRLNTYGDQSKCISHYALKLYCYCN